MIRARKTPLPVADCCRLLGVSRASFYRPAAERTRPDDEALVRLAGEHPRYGYRRLAVLAGIGKNAMRNRTSRRPVVVPQSGFAGTERFRRKLLLEVQRRSRQTCGNPPATPKPNARSEPSSTTTISPDGTRPS